MMDYPTLNFPPIHLRARRSANGRTEIFDAVRGRWLVLTPEEWVRRHVVEYLRTECGFQPQLIVEEHPVNINGMAQRADIVVMGDDMRPLLVVECKEPNIKIGDEVLRQVVRYNSVLGCRYIALTNGLTTYCYEHDGEKYSPIKSFPHAK
ncbi:MAG: type I restriction enzyme HsdR N-terminal domain-containing protein [Alistipes sp.]|nr:type I restriction enzyme HsdR N-terminal domain-containing protein [Alistipes sp.]